MFLVAARACTVTVLLTAAAVRAEEARNPVPSTPPGDELTAAPWLRCEPTPTTTADSQDAWNLRVAGPMLYPEPGRAATPVSAPAFRVGPSAIRLRRDIERVPLIMLWESRTSAMFLGINRRGLGGLHFERKSARERAAERTARAPLRAHWRAAEPIQP